MSERIAHLPQDCVPIWRRAVRAGLDFLYPPFCPLCDVETRSTADDTTQPAFCDSCRTDLAPWIEFSCQRCGAPCGPYLETSSGCLHCRDERFAFERVIRLGVYDNLLRRACLRAKGTHGERLAAGLAGLLLMSEGKELRSACVDLVVPVPQHWLTRVRRPHNPAESLATVLARDLRIRCERRPLVKTRHTPPQHLLNGTQRRSNLRNAFRVRRPEAISSRHVLLVDDVLTTGATAHAASKALRKAGAARVTVVVIARGLGTQRAAST